MDSQQFWALIDAAKVIPGKRAVVVGRALKKLPPEEIAAFDGWFRAYHAAAMRQDLWAAIHAILGECTEESFSDFRAWLVGRGEAALTGAVEDPESLAVTVGRGDPRDPLLLGAARETYKALTQGELPEGAAPTPTGVDGWPADRFAPGLTWDAAWIEANYPKLFARSQPKAPRTSAKTRAAVVRVAQPQVVADLSRPVRTYSAADQYQPADRIAHPTFGEGVVEVAEPGKVTVYFSVGRKVLVQSKAGAVTGGETPRPKPFAHDSAAGGWFVGKA